MFASCCNWMCPDSSDDGSGESEGHHNSYTNSAFSIPPSPQQELACKACGICFSAHTKKHFYGNLLVRSELMKLKVRELREYLHLHGISTHLCREKEELVELVLCQQYSLPNSAADSPTAVNLGETTIHHDLNCQITSDVPDLSTPSLISEDGSAPPDSPTPPTHVTNLEPDFQARDQSDEAIVTIRRASLSDLSCLDDVDLLSVRQLKEILARNFVNFTGCCEKWELMERVRRLYLEQQRLQAENAAEIPESGTEGVIPNLEENLCKICMDCPIDCVLLECGHMVTCTKCGKRMNECPVCRQYVVRAVHVFRS
ncbi:E3 ubiquitin-protein ligase rififylin isoform X3 [Takifugu rubripes]|uniref:E3 ubiquitin-protein ligase rififylin isoform X3 n=1 Tax=Takifugu rubripes TaxID=31033 RepID=UPI0005D24FC9|nr:E3 ubiquitin-protein ligase rififylin isoform X3 [Takifugu rubripes]XP_056906219.1 E3 ubiquitin-protein ligase rififylin isoform X3 [Takifugu flavidus]|eukprot:XP_011606620.1 PREDICTED: E3 ubiquitin-protein ligase rififylin isoform X3 [Takifugu rubripes]